MISQSAAHRQRQVDSVQKRIALCSDQRDLRLEKAAPHIQQFKIANISLAIPQLRELCGTLHGIRLLTTRIAYCSDEVLPPQRIQDILKGDLNGARVLRLALLSNCISPLHV